MRYILLVVVTILSASPTFAEFSDFMVANAEIIRSGIVSVLSAATELQGTGVIVYLNGNARVITNKHITGDSLDCLIGISGKNGQRSFILGTVECSSDALDVSVVQMSSNENKTKNLLKSLFGDTDVDELIFKLDPKEFRIIDNKVDATKSSLRAFPPTMLAQNQQVLPGSPAYFVGFPLGIGVTNMEPLVRSGVIASKPKDGSFLLDAMVNSGNSGSPVFIKKLNEESYFLAGIVSSSRLAYVDYQSNTNPPQVIKLPHNAGLANIISIEDIEKFFITAKK